MPLHTTHLHLCALLLPKMRGIDAYTLCLGSIAPDCFNASDQEAFHTAHNLDDAGRFDYLRFYMAQQSGLQQKDLPTSSYILGYFSHLWFDAFARDVEETILIEQPTEQPADRQLLRSEIMGLDKSAVLQMSASIKTPPRPIELPVIGDIDPNKTADKYKTTIACLHRLHAGALPERFICASAYVDFLEAAKSDFLEYLKNIDAHDCGWQAI